MAAASISPGMEGSDADADTDADAATMAAAALCGDADDDATMADAADCNGVSGTNHGGNRESSLGTPLISSAPSASGEGEVVNSEGGGGG